MNIQEELQQFIDERKANLSTSAISILGLTDPINRGMLEMLWVKIFLGKKLREIEHKQGIQQQLKLAKRDLIQQRLTNCVTAKDVLDELIHFMIYDLEGGHADTLSLDELKQIRGGL